MHGHALGCWLPLVADVTLGETVCLSEEESQRGLRLRAAGFLPSRGWGIDIVSWFRVHIPRWE
jgi:hypothetical protein